MNVEGVTQEDLKQCLGCGTHPAASYYYRVAVVTFDWLTMEFILVGRSHLQRIYRWLSVDRVYRTPQMVLNSIQSSCLLGPGLEVYDLSGGR